MKMVQVKQKGGMNKGGLAIILIAVSLLAIAFVVIPIFRDAGSKPETAVEPSLDNEEQVDDRITGGDTIMGSGGFEKIDPEAEALVAQDIDGLDGTIRARGSVEVSLEVDDPGGVTYSWGSDNTEIEINDPDDASPTITFSGVHSGDTVLINVMVFMSSGSHVYREKEVTIAPRPVVRRPPAPEPEDPGDGGESGDGDDDGSDDSGGDSGDGDGGEKPTF